MDKELGHNLKWLEAELDIAKCQPSCGQASLTRFSIFLDKLNKLAKAHHDGLYSNWTIPEGAYCYHYSKLPRSAVICQKKALRMIEILENIDCLFTTRFASSLAPMRMLSDWLIEIINLNKEIRSVKVPTASWQAGQRLALSLVSKILSICVARLSEATVEQEIRLDVGIFDALPDLLGSCFADSNVADIPAPIGEQAIELARWLVDHRRSLALWVGSKAVDSTIIKLRYIYKTALRKFLATSSLMDSPPTSLVMLASGLFDGDKSSLANFGKIVCRQSKPRWVAMDLISLRGVVRNKSMAEGARVWPILSYHLRNEHPLITQRALELARYLIKTKQLTDKETRLLLKRIYYLTSDASATRCYSAQLASLIVETIIDLMPNEDRRAGWHVGLLNRVGRILSDINADHVEEQHTRVAQMAVKVLQDKEAVAMIVDHVSRSFVLRLNKDPVHGQDFGPIEGKLKFVDDNHRETSQAHSITERMLVAMCDYGRRNPLGDIDQNFLTILESNRADPNSYSKSCQLIPWHLACGLFGLVNPKTLSSWCLVLEQVARDGGRQRWTEQLQLSCMNFVRQTTMRPSIRDDAFDFLDNGGERIPFYNLTSTMLRSAAKSELSQHLYPIIANLASADCRSEPLNDVLAENKPARGAESSLFGVTLLALAHDRVRFVQSFSAYRLAQSKDSDGEPTPEWLLNVTENSKNMFGEFIRRWLDRTQLVCDTCTMRLELMALCALISWHDASRPGVVTRRSEAIVSRLMEIVVACCDEPEHARLGDVELASLREAITSSKARESWNRSLLQHLDADQIAQLEKFALLDEGQATVAESTGDEDESSIDSDEDESSIDSDEDSEDESHQNDHSQQ